MALVQCAHGWYEADSATAEEEISPVFAQRAYIVEDLGIGRDGRATEGCAYGEASCAMSLEGSY
jgi:hypothetical protein